MADARSMLAGRLVDLRGVVDLLRDPEWHEREAIRLRAALQHIATGGVAGPPALTFAERILAGDSIEAAHTEAKARHGHG